MLSISISETIDLQECKSMSLDIANSNVNRNITLAGTSVAIFTFLLFFLYPRSGDINSILFQFTLAIIVSVIFSLVISALYYYGTALTLTLRPDQATTIFGKAEAFWLVGYSLLLLEPSLILARRLQPTAAGAKLDSIYREPDRCRAVWTSSLVLLPVPYLAPVQETNQEKVIPPYTILRSSFLRACARRGRLMRPCF